ncbi:MAG TPA: ABC transporter permease [Candidatus Limnocylindrales bacterium]|nr:ABC transporter permease [Candidatus Limnocylindrales bacterium]
MNPFSAAATWLGDAGSWQGPNGIPLRITEHLEISLASLVLAAIVALPAGLYIGHSRRGVGLAVGVANVGRAVPSIALMGILLPITQAVDPINGFFVYPTLLAMAILAVPPILVNAYAGVAEVDADVVEAARAMGLREGQILRAVEVPLALPVIIDGLRSAAVQVVATATLGAILGFGGLGRYIVDGIAQQDDGMLYGGVALVAILAVGSEALLVLVQRFVARRRGVEEPREPVGAPPEASAAPAS